MSVDLDERLARLAQSVEAGKRRQQAQMEAAKAERAALWAKVQTEAPEAAEFLSAMNAAFGRPKAVAVKVGEEVILNQGSWR